MLKSLIQPQQTAVKIPVGFVKVTNLRKGEILLPCAPKELPPGVSYHDQDLFNEMADNFPHAVASLQAHMSDGDLRFEAADVAPPQEKPAPFVPAPMSDEKQAPKVSALANDPAGAFAQIEAETDAAVLAEWFESRPSVEISDAILARLTVLNPS
jgi:hypothetical protein